MLMTKACVTCLEVKPLTAFPPRGAGHRGQCRACYRAAKRVWLKRQIENGTLIKVTPVEKMCARCKLTKPAEEFHKSNRRRDGRRENCKSCRTSQYLKDPEPAKRRAMKHKQSTRHLRVKTDKPYKPMSATSRIGGGKYYAQKLRAIVIGAYGGRCACCLEWRHEFLAIDHINGGGGKLRREVEGGSTWRWLALNGYPDGYQVLCHNCNYAKGAFGACPHSKPGIYYSGRVIRGPLEDDADSQYRNEGYRAKRRSYLKRVKTEAMQAYGGACACCGASELAFLTIDHPNNDGQAHRTVTGGGGHKTYKWLRGHGYPAGYRALCFNCNCSLGFYGYCPHNA